MFTLATAQQQMLRRERNRTNMLPNPLRIERRRINRTGRGYYTVESSDSGKSDLYQVCLNTTSTYPNGHCTCPDFIYRRFPRGETCKHMDSCTLWFGIEDCETPAEQAQRDLAVDLKAAVGGTITAQDAEDYLRKRDERMAQHERDSSSAFTYAMAEKRASSFGQMVRERAKARKAAAEAAESPKEAPYDTLTTIALPATLEHTIALLELARRLQRSLVALNPQAVYDRVEVRPGIITITGERTNALIVVGVRKEETKPS